jgi:hypothetical protein
MAQLQATTVNGTLNSLQTENNTTASKSLALTDRDRVVACTNTTAITITVPNDSSVNFPVGSVVYIARLGTGTVALAAAGGVTLTKTGNFAQVEELYVRKRAANSWIVVDQPRNPIASGGTFAESNGIATNTFTSTGSSTLVIGS